MVECKPVILHEADLEEGWDDERHGRVQWRTLFSNDSTPTEQLTAGVAQIQPGDHLKEHRHAPPELYYVLDGEGIVRIDGSDYHVSANSAVFIPGNAVHGLRNAGQASLNVLYVFAASSFGEVEYIFEE